MNLHSGIHNDVLHRKPGGNNNKLNLSLHNYLINHLTSLFCTKSLADKYSTELNSVDQTKSYSLYVSENAIYRFLFDEGYSKNI